MRVLALAAAAALAIFALSFQESPRPAVLPSAPAPQRLFALQVDLERLMSTPAAQWRAAVEAPLLTEARLLADDGERVARALVASLPSPLRRNLPLWRQATSPQLR